MTKSYEELVLGRWNFNGVITDGPGYGTILDGYFLISSLNGVTSGKLYMPEKPAEAVAVSVNGMKVTLAVSSLNINAEGWFRGPNVITGDFTRSGRDSGRWVVARSFESTTKLKGTYNFEAELLKGANKGLRLDGVLQLDQEIIQRPSFFGADTTVSGTLQLAKLPQTFKVNGIANGGEVHFVIERAGLKILATDAMVTKNVLEGKLIGPSKTELGNWKATLKPEPPDASVNEWEFKAKVEQGPGKGTQLEGMLEFTQSADGTLTGTFEPEKAGAALSVTGKVSPQGHIQFSMGGINFNGQFERFHEKGASGTFVNTNNRATGKWGIKFES